MKERVGKTGAMRSQVTIERVLLSYNTGDVPNALHDGWSKTHPKENQHPEKRRQAPIATGSGKLMVPGARTSERHWRRCAAWTQLHLHSQSSAAPLALGF